MTLDDFKPPKADIEALQLVSDLSKHCDGIFKKLSAISTDQDLGGIKIIPEDLTHQISFEIAKLVITIVEDYYVEDNTVLDKKGLTMLIFSAITNLSSIMTTLHVANGVIDSAIKTANDNLGESGKATKDIGLSFGMYQLLDPKSMSYSMISEVMETPTGVAKQALRKLSEQIINDLAERNKK